MDIPAHAKINLSLDITGIREDGYHLVFRAVRLMRETFRLRPGVKILLEKRIPLAAGLAGGSTDAAAALRGMNELFSIGLNTEALCRLGVRLGADVPYCLTGGTALSEGIGEILTPLPSLPSCFLVLAKPRAEVSTAEAYRAYDRAGEVPRPDTAGLIRALEETDLDGVAARVRNVLEPVTAAVHPEVMRIREQMLETGAAGACMSGSGPTVFGIFRDRNTAETACGILRKEPDREVILTEPVRNGRTA